MNAFIENLRPLKNRLFIVAAVCDGCILTLPAIGKKTGGAPASGTAALLKG